MIKILLHFLFFLSLSCSVWGADRDTASPDIFDPLAANTQLDQLNLRLATEELQLTRLQAVAADIKVLYDQAKHCLEINQQQLNEIKRQLTLLDEGTVSDATLSVDRIYLQNKYNELMPIVSECRLFVLRADEAIDVYDKKIAALITQTLYTAQASYWKNLKAVWQEPLKYYKQFDQEAFYQQWGVYNISIGFAWVFLIVVLLSMLLSLRARRMTSAYLDNVSLEQHSLVKIQWLLTYQHYSLILGAIIPLSFTLILWDIFSQSWSISLQSWNLIFYLSIALSTYIIAIFIAAFMFYAPKLEDKWTPLSSALASSLLRRLHIVFILMIISGFIYFVLLQQPEIAMEIRQLIHATLFTLLSISLLSLAWLVSKAIKLNKLWRIVVNILLLIGVVILILFEWLGYQQLSVHLLYASMMTLLLLSITSFLHKLIGYLFRGSGEPLPFWQLLIHKAIGKNTRKQLIEILALNGLLILLLWITFILILIKVWEISDYEFYNLVNILLEGGSLFGMTIVPANILLGIVLVIILMLFTRLVRNYYLQHASQHIHYGAKEAIATVIGYIGFGLSVIMGLVVAGINFTGIALILGGLSVGVGLGLQNITNNFVSGLILLLERPIKQGDRIMVGDTEGFVKKISIRSTQISTLQKSDVIVPNSELIANQVVNYMFKDDISRISVSVGVAYGSDVDKVKDILLKVAEEHSQVITNNDELKPIVLFKEFGNSSLVFELWCMLYSVNSKYVVASELHFAINKAFKESGIEIAFPQRDLHIKNWPPLDKK